MAGKSKGSSMTCKSSHDSIHLGQKVWEWALVFQGHVFNVHRGILFMATKRLT